MNRKITLEQESEIVKLLEVKSQKEVSMNCIIPILLREYLIVMVLYP